MHIVANVEWGRISGPVSTVATVHRPSSSVPKEPTAEATKNAKTPPQYLEDMLPITILTGYLGAGKTTLLNRILTGGHGQRIAVVQNDYGAVAIDNDLVVEVEEAMITLANGCACCTVRDDMIDAVETLAAGPRRFDRIVVETTGLASPGSIVMTFLAHPDAGELFALDGVVTVADALHLPAQLARGPEAGEGIAYADHILLNKMDCVDAAGLAEAERLIRAINPTAPLTCTTHAAADVAELLDVDGLNPERLAARMGRSMEWLAAAAAARHAGAHGVGVHEAGVRAVALEQVGAVDSDALDAWIDALLAERHEDIYRIKGIIHAAGSERRYVVQGVHRLWTRGYARAWGDAERASRLVVIGRGLDASALRAGFARCLVGG